MRKENEVCYGEPVNADSDPQSFRNALMDLATGLLLGTGIMKAPIIIRGER